MAWETMRGVVGVLSGAVYDVSEFAEYRAVVLGEGMEEEDGLFCYVFVGILRCRGGFGVAVVHFMLF